MSRLQDEFYAYLDSRMLTPERWAAQDERDRRSTVRAFLASHQETHVQARVELPLTPEEALRDYPAAVVRRVFAGPVGYAAVGLGGLLIGVIAAAVGAGQ